MSVIERQIKVSYRHQILFTKDLFAPDNALFCDTLVDGQHDCIHKVLVVMDEAPVSYTHLTLPTIYSV